MEYNTTRGPLLISEYGRNIQKMIDYITSIEDREKRTKAAKFIVNVMAQMHPQVRDTVDYKHKLWDHLFFMSDFHLDVEPPYPPPPPQALSTKPERIGYHDKDIQFRHYGKNIALIIEKATEYEEGPEKDALVKTIANHLKKSYLNWNRESVTDELIEDHLKVLSQDRLKLHEAIKLATTNDILARNKKRKFVKPKENGNNAMKGRKKMQ
jgi:hypothetical protein